MVGRKRFGWEIARNNTLEDDVNIAVRSSMDENAWKVYVLVQVRAEWRRKRKRAPPKDKISMKR